jgi:hypothetical protein
MSLSPGCFRGIADLTRERGLEVELLAFDSVRTAFRIWHGCFICLADMRPHGKGRRGLEKPESHEDLFGKRR